MDKVKMFCVTHNVDGNFLTNHVVGVSKEDIRERYGSGLDIKRITQVDIAIDMMQVIDALCDGGLSIAPLNLLHKKRVARPAVMQPWTVTSPCKCRVRKIKASRTGGSNERATRK